MRKLSFTLLLALGVSMAYAQSEKIMLGASGRLFGPACTNCEALYGGGVSAGYAFTEKIVATFDLGIYSKSIGSEKINSTAIGVSGDYYIREAFKGFYIGPDVTYILLTYKTGSIKNTDNNLTVGLNLGWAIAIGDRFRIVPHFGYGTWFENSKGRITAGAKFAFKI